MLGWSPSYIYENFDKTRLSLLSETSQFVNTVDATHSNATKSCQFRFRKHINFVFWNKQIRLQLRLLASECSVCSVDHHPPHPGTFPNPNLWKNISTFQSPQPLLLNPQTNHINPLKSAIVCHRVGRVGYVRETCLPKSWLMYNQTYSLAAAHRDTSTVFMWHLQNRSPHIPSTFPHWLPGNGKTPAISCQSISRLYRRSKIHRNVRK